jgi:tungstate transport system substrate-binding protein
MIRRSAAKLALLTALALASATDARAADRFITVASTTSTQNSGLFEYLLPKFTAKTGIAVHVVAVGTGAALKIGERGDADVLLVHARDAEIGFVKAGYAVKRDPVMYNDFVIVGPKSDPARIMGGRDAIAAFQKIAAAKALFVSRGDDSGTNKAERKLWKAAGIDPIPASGTWYQAAGAGMGATLNMTAARDGYTLADRGTWISFRNRQGLVVLVEGDRRLFNQYGVMLVNPKRHPKVKVEAGQAFIDWLVSPEGQRVIASYRLNGQELFFPDANVPGR